ncbi:MAG: hypothetical protein J5I83_10510, partial [Nitrosomonas communis]
KDRQPKELKERLPKETKDRLPKELTPKERLPKELAPKELKERGPKELKEIREIQLGDPFIRPELRPDLSQAVFDINQTGDITDLQDEMLLRQANLLGGRNPSDV